MRAALKAKTPRPFERRSYLDQRLNRGEGYSLFRRNPRLPEQSAFVSRCHAGSAPENAGAIPLARTNLPDLLFAFESDNLIFGRTSNPFDPARTSGGSSGGEAALIAAGGSPLQSRQRRSKRRLPAHYCGIAAIKPTSGATPENRSRTARRRLDRATNRTHGQTCRRSAGHDENPGGGSGWERPNSGLPMPFLRWSKKHGAHESHSSLITASCSPTPILDPQSITRRKRLKTPAAP